MLDKSRSGSTIPFGRSALAKLVRVGSGLEMRETFISDFDHGREGIEKSTIELHSEAEVKGSSLASDGVCEVLQDWLKSRSHTKSRRAPSLR